MLKELKRQRLQTLARAFTEKNDLAVKLGSVSATDLSNIEIKHCDGEIVLGVPASPAECWVALKAMDAHESAHVLFTAEGVMEEAGRKGGLLLQHILNVLEDARAERAMANAYPGTLSWFRFTNEYVYRNRKDWGEGAAAFMQGLCAYAVVGKIPDALSQEAKDLIEKCKPFVDEARLAGSTWEVLQRAEKIYALAKDAFPSPSLPPVAMRGTDSPQEAPQGSLDPRRVPKRRKERQENNSGDSSGEPQENNEGDRESADGENGSGESAEKKRSSKNASDDSGEGPENEPETSEEDEDGSFGEDRSGKSGEAESKPKEQNDPGSGGEENSKEEADGEGDDPTSGEDGGSGETHTGDENGGIGETGDGESSAGGDPDDDNEGSSGAENADPGNWDGDEQDEQDPGDFEEVAGDQDDEPDLQPSGDEEGDWDEGDGVPEDGGSGDPATPEPGDFGEDEEDPDDGDFSSLLEEAENELSRMENDAERREKEAARSAAPEPDWTKIRKEVSKDLHQGCRFTNMDVAARPNEYRKLVQFQQGLIRRLVEEIRKALEYRPAVPRRNLKKGRLDAGSLWKLRVPDPQVFSRREIPGDIPELAVYLLVDCSGSMRNLQYTSRGYSAKPKIDMAREAACALHEACAQLKITHCVVGFASNFPSTYFLQAVDWSRQDGAAIAALEYQSACNRDGYVIRVVARDLKLRPEPRKVLIVLSDGLPNDEKDGRYSIRFTSVPVADTAKAVRELERQGIGVIGIFFVPEEDLPRAQTIYNRLVYVEDVGNLPVILGRVLKQVITQGA